MSKSILANLTERGNALEERFKSAVDDPGSPELLAVVADLRGWLDQCVAQGRFLPAGSPERRSLQGQVDYWTSRLGQAGHAVDEIDRLAPFDPKAGHVLADELFPYHGLLAATGSGKVFAGRDEQIHEYADHIDSHAALLIQSESGGGKSSVAMAGVLPELQRRHPGWRVLARVTPGTLPADTLREALGSLLSLATVDAASVQAALKADEVLLVYVDQLEELLTMCTDVQQQEAFSTLLATLADAGVLRLVATMRVDHYERLAQSNACHRLFALLTRDGSVKTLPPMSLAQIRSVILKPAEAVGLRFVPASLVETLASECAATASGLPLLQFALQRLWDERPREGDRPDGARLDMITPDSMRKLPSVSQALSTVADRYLAELTALGLVDACQRLMLELTVIDERLEVPLRRRRAEQELLNVLAATALARPDQAQALVDGLVDRRLLVRTGEGVGRQIEVAHETLFRHWEQFQAWLNDAGVRARLRDTQSINREAVLWDQSGRKADYLKLVGELLARAVHHRQAHWLEPLAVAYVQACEQSVRDGEQALAHEQALAAQAKADADAAQARALEAQDEALKAQTQVLQAKAQALQDRTQALKARARVRTFWQVASLVGLGAVALVAWNENDRRRELELRSTTAIAYVLPQLSPANALDLAYTLHDKRSSPESRATLAHAISEVGNVVLVGRREDGTASFTYSGQATVQLISLKQGPDSKVDHAQVRVMGPRLEDLAPAVKVPLGLKDDEDVAALDVGPPMAKNDALGVADGDRLAVVRVLASDGAQGKALRLMRIFRIGKTPQATLVAEVPFPNEPRPTRSASEISFDRSGTQLAVSARLRVAAGLSGDQTATQLLYWTLNGPTRLDPRKDPEEAITALAFTESPQPVLIKGRTDGRVDCGDTGYTELKGSGLPYAKKPPRVMALKFADATRFVAVHDDNSISVGDCAPPRPQMQTLQADGPDKPEPLAVWPTTVLDDQQRPEDGLAVSYSLRGQLVCQTFNLRTNRRGQCAGDGQLAPGAVPALDKNGRLLGYRVLAGTRPLMTFITTAPTGDAGDKDTARGVPVASLKPDTPGRSVAASPNGMQLLTIGRQDGPGKPTEVYRPGAPRSAMKTIKDPQWAAVNDQGAAAVLTARRAEVQHELSLFGPDEQLLGRVPTFPDAACLKLSPDGRQTLVASDEGKVKWFEMGRPPAAAAVETQGFGDVWRDPVTACATGNGGRSETVVVLATQSGKVRRHDAKTGQWWPMSELVPFQLGAPALDVSIDGSSRFVAVVSIRRTAACRDGADGHLLRIWDLQLRLPDYPVASACIALPLQSIGPLRQLDNGGGWALPMYLQRNPGDADNVVSQQDFPCLACDAGGKAQQVDDRIRQRAQALGAQPLRDGELQKVYGIAP